ncbi:uncharacterized protein LOC131226221 [Magnolia sinica]|uniref:uncharacterized protein LOC131226221 n=1 Tax=Magnolia sinica TaxID=86752 RepID=UPI002657C25F|nr:uncharacterized protein LOC131226221 [Magnolia sinica]
MCAFLSQRLKPCCIRRYVPCRMCSLGHRARHSLRTYFGSGRTGDQLWFVMSICGKVLDRGENIELLVDKTKNLRSQVVNLNIIEGLNLLKDSEILVLMPFTATQLTKY